MTAKLPTYKILELAVESETCPATVVKALAGGAVRGRAGARVTAVLAKHGLKPPAAAAPEPAAGIAMDAAGGPPGAGSTR